MAGMIQILTDMLAVYLIVKGIEVLQIALASTRQQRSGIITIGILTLFTCIYAAWFFVNWQDEQAKSMQNTMKTIQE
ncbi:MAG: hypothetical protein K2Y22_04020 [Candidatus Obscuribacterales bacterium]|nr:hypothetical protein [Candidatus Obscuribacterales bacterium]